MELRILIIEDEVIIARFIEQHIQKNYKEVITEIAISSEEVRQLMPCFRPHVILCDIELNEETDGIELMHEFALDQRFELIFITSFQSKQTMDRAFELSPINYIIKPVDENRLYAGIQPAMHRLAQTLEEEHLPSKNMDSWQSELSRWKSEIRLLSTGELEILKMIAKKLTSKQIAEKLFLSPYTVKNARHKICRKLCLEEENNALLTWAIRHQKFLDNYTHT